VVEAVKQFFDEFGSLSRFEAERLMKELLRCWHHDGVLDV
jgi:hypothetical protein